MPPISNTVDAEYDFIVLGGGSGGFGASVRLVSHVATVISLVRSFPRCFCSDVLEITERRLPLLNVLMHLVVLASMLVS